MSAIKKMTNGKWKVVHELNVQSESGRFVCACGRNSHEKDNWAQNTSNAQVIAEVPNMIDMLRRIYQDFLNSGANEDEWMGRHAKDLTEFFDRLETNSNVATGKG